MKSMVGKMVDPQLVMLGLLYDMSEEDFQVEYNTKLPDHMYRFCS